MISQRFYPVVGGTEKQALLLSKKLIQNGLGVSVVTEKLKGFKSSESIDGVSVKRLFTYFEGLIGSVIFGFMLFFYLLFNRNKYDILHVHLASSHAIAAMLANFALKKKIVVKMGASREYGDIRTSSTTFFGRLKIGLIRRYADCVVVPNREMINELVVAGFENGKLMSIPNGVDHEDFMPLAESEKGRKKRELNISSKYLAVFIGRLNKQKAPDVLIKAWKKVCETRDDIHLAILEAAP